MSESITAEDDTASEESPMIPPHEIKKEVSESITVEEDIASEESPIIPPNEIKKEASESIAEDEDIVSEEMQLENYLDQEIKENADLHVAKDSDDVAVPVSAQLSDTYERLSLPHEANAPKRTILESILKLLFGCFGYGCSK